MSTVLDMRDKYRALLTDVLPYETVLRFDNEDFRKNMQTAALKEIIEGICEGQKWFIPFNYTVRRSTGDHTRELSIIHPMSQLDVVDFYEKYDTRIIYCCSLSPFSIRRPHRVAECTFDSEVVDEHRKKIAEKMRVELDDVEVKQCEDLFVSYFTYKDYDRAYKFFLSGVFMRLEQKYSYRATIDISHCFYNIYTHSITWAVKGKKIAKASIKKDNFENLFDKLEQRCNYNETHGIVVGPEFSRLFAEVIFQRIDLNIIDKLKANGLIFGIDYEVKRYVDDSYIFANSMETIQKIKQVYAECLTQYKLYINEGKYNCEERPFGSHIDDAKEKITDILGEIISIKDEKGDKDKNVVKTAYICSTKSLAYRLRTLAHQTGAKYHEFMHYALGMFIKKILEILGNGNIKISNSFLVSVIEMAFYMFSLEMTATTSVKLCKFVFRIWDDKQCRESDDNRREVSTTIEREAKRILNIHRWDNKDSITNIENLNLLLLLDAITGERFSQDELIRFFGIDKDGKESFKVNYLNYFQFCVLLYLIGNASEYEELRKSLIQGIKDKMTVNNAWKYSELTLLFLDSMACPFINAKDKDEIASHYLVGSSIKIDKKNIISQLVKQSRWFFDWEEKHNLNDYVRKKEYHSTY